MKKENKRYLQLSLLDSDEKTKLRLGEIRVTKLRKRDKADEYLEEGLQLLLKTSDRKSIALQRLFAYIIKLLRNMEERNICYLKKTRSDGLRIFKTYYCCRGLKEWKKCPKYRCTIWPCDTHNEEACPFYEKDDDIRMTADEEI
jgi:hypothetical protein